MTAPPSTPAPVEGSRFTRLLFAIAIAIAAVALGSRLVRGLRTGEVPWLDMALPGAAILMLAGILVGPRRRWLYVPLLVTSFALLVTFYALPHRPPAPPEAPAARPAAPAPR